MITLYMIFFYIDLTAAPHLCRLPVVGLGLVEASSAGPVSRVALVGGADLAAGAGPEPAVHVGGQEVGAVTTVEVTLAARSPDVPESAKV